jgi:transcriptional regulator GlxA family with amidase domain
VTSAPHRVGILVFDDMKLLDFAGPTEVFTEANNFGADYRISMVSVDGRDVRSSVGLRIPVDAAASTAGPFDTVIVVGGEAFPAGEVTQSLASAAFEMSLGASRTASICTGAFVLAAAGLLEGKRATTHWNHARELARRYPGTRVEPDEIVLKDDGTYTSAGVTAGIDLALALVEEDEGIELTKSVARSLVVYLRREGGQQQFSGSLQGRVPRGSLLNTVIDAVNADPAADYTVARLAEIARVSPRHLSRLFHDELATTPNKYVELIRLDRAKSLLDEGQSVTQVAESAGFGTSESMRRAFIAHLSIPPSKYRGRFASTRA